MPSNWSYDKEVHSPMKWRSDNSDAPRDAAPALMAPGNRYFSMPGKYLADLDTDTSAKLIGASADIVLVLDELSRVRRG